MRGYTWGLVSVLAVGVSSQPFSCFPRMRSTPSIKPYERVMPTAPRGTVPFAQDTPSPQRIDTLATRARPVPATAENIATGGVYYTYYCEMCHGPGGAGEGSVGHSYVPRAPALNTARVRGMGEEQLVRAMLTGVGHSPVLSSTVAPERRGYIGVLLRSLSAKTPPQQQAARGQN